MTQKTSISTEFCNVSHNQLLKKLQQLRIHFFNCKHTILSVWPETREKAESAVKNWNKNLIRKCQKDGGPYPEPIPHEHYPRPIKQNWKNIIIHFVYFLVKYIMMFCSSIIHNVIYIYIYIYIKQILHISLNGDMQRSRCYSTRAL